MLKKVVVIAVFLLFPVFAGATDTNPWDIKLPFKTATIDYLLSGIEEGSETLYIRDYGKKTAKYHTSSMNLMGIRKTAETVEFVDQDWIYTFDLIERTGTKAVNPRKYMIEEYNNLSESEKKQVLRNSEEMGAGVLFGGMSTDVEKKAAEILGYQCDRVTIMGSTVYSIHGTGISLKTETNIMGMRILVEATRIDTGTAPKEYFAHPEGITAGMDPDAQAMARSLAKETITMLKDPEAMAKARNQKGQSGQQNQLTPEEQQEMEQAVETLKSIFGGAN